MRRSSAQVAALLLAARAGTLSAAEVQHVDVERDGKRFSVTVDVVVAATMPQVFEVLTDFAALPGLSDAIEESRVDAAVSDDEWLVYTRVKACAFFQCRRVQRVERVWAHYPCEIEAELADGETNLKASASHWRLSPSGDGTRLHFSTTIEPDFWVPGKLGERPVRKMVLNSVLDSMREAERRAADGESKATAQAGTP
ncbi:MAG: SRPBCC family protein [Pseudomonadota bacterium]